MSSCDSCFVKCLIHTIFFDKTEGVCWSHQKRKVMYSIPSRKTLPKVKQFTHSNKELQGWILSFIEHTIAEQNLLATTSQCLWRTFETQRSTYIFMKVENLIQSYFSDYHLGGGMNDFKARGFVVTFPISHCFLWVGCVLLIAQSSQTWQEEWPAFLLQACWNDCWKSKQTLLHNVHFNSAHTSCWSCCWSDNGVHTELQPSGLHHAPQPFYHSHFLLHVYCLCDLSNRQRYHSLLPSFPYHCNAFKLAKGSAVSF